MHALTNRGVNNYWKSTTQSRTVCVRSQDLVRKLGWDSLEGRSLLVCFIRSETIFLIFASPHSSDYTSNLSRFRKIRQMLPIQKLSAKSSLNILESERNKKDGIFSFSLAWDKEKIWVPDGNRTHGLPYTVGSVGSLLNHRATGRLGASKISFTRCHGFNSRRGLRVFLRPTLVTNWISHLPNIFLLDHIVLSMISASFIERCSYCSSWLDKLTF